MGCSDEMEPDDDKKKINDDFIKFIGKQSEDKIPRYTDKIKAYIDLQRKRDRANAARRNYENRREKTVTPSSKKGDDEAKDKALDKSEHPGGDKQRFSSREKCTTRTRSGEPLDKCGGRRRRRRRKRSCRRRRRSCRRKRRRRRRSRRRSRSRRRRRRSCCRRRRRRRRRRCGN